MNPRLLHQQGEFSQKQTCGWEVKEEGADAFVK
jgi:hypothetical protein